MADGLTRALNDFAGDHRTKVRERNSINTMAVITCDRPQRLRNALNSYIQSSRHGSLRYVVVDDSRSISSQNANLAISAEIARSTGARIEVWGAKQRRELAHYLETTGIRRELIEFLIPISSQFRSHGGSRNLLTLLTQGENVLCVDDDTSNKTWQPPDRNAACRLCGHPSFLDVRFVKDEQLQECIDTSSQVDLTSEVGEWLGLSLGDLGGKTLDTTLACDRLLWSYHARPHEFNVKFVFPGIVGSSGLQSTTGYLFSLGETRQLMASTPEMYAQALQGSSVVRMSPTATITHDYTKCMMTAFAFNSDSDIPPFFPFGRNEDGLFGAMIGRLHPEHLSAHLPIAVLHEGNRESCMRKLNFVGPVRIADLFIQLLAEGPTLGFDSVDLRYAVLGEYLSKLGSKSQQDFREDLVRCVAAFQCRHIDWVERELKSNFPYPTEWRRDLEVWCNTTRSRLASGDLIIPTDLADESNPIDQIQSMLLLFGESITQWPRITYAAKQHMLSMPMAT